MAVNQAFTTSGKLASASEQNLYADLIKEAIQIHGHDVNYVDRTLTARDDIFGEDSLSTFSKQQTIEMYVEDAEGGYQGEKELIQHLLKGQSKPERVQVILVKILLLTLDLKVNQNLARN